MGQPPQDAVDAGTMPPKRVVDTAKTGAERGKGAAELAAERVALQEEKGEESSDDEFLMPGERRLKNRQAGGAAAELADGGVGGQ